MKLEITIHYDLGMSIDSLVDVRIVNVNREQLEDMEPRFFDYFSIESFNRGYVSTEASKTDSIDDMKNTNERTTLSGTTRLWNLSNLSNAAEKVLMSYNTYTTATKFLMDFTKEFERSCYRKDIELSISIPSHHSTRLEDQIPKQNSESKEREMDI